MDNEIRRLFDNATNASEKRNFTYGILGRLNTDGSVTVPVLGRPKFVYVRVGPSGSQTTTVAKNTANVAERANMPVRMKKDGNLLVIQDINTSTNEAATPVETPNMFGVPYHTHMIGTDLEYVVESLRLEPGLVRPTGQLNVQVQPFRYRNGDEWKTFMGDSIDLAIFHQPLVTGKWRWVVLSVKPDDATLEVYSGPDTPVATPLTIDLIDAIDIGNNIPVGAVKVRYDDSKLTDMTRHYDARNWLTGNMYSFDDLTDVDVAGVTLGQTIHWNDDDGVWEPHTLTHNDISDWGEAVTDTMGPQMLAGSSKLSVVFDDSANTVTYDVVTANIDHGGLGGLTDEIDHPTYLTMSGARVGGGSVPQAFSNSITADWYDYNLMDTTNGDQFITAGFTTPTGWTQVNAPVGQTISGSFWSIRGSAAVPVWGFRKQSPYTISSVGIGSGNYGCVLFGPILIPAVNYSEDVDYYFGLYRDNAGAIDTATFSRVNLHWDIATNVWKVRHEYKDGTTQTNGNWYLLASPPLLTPVYFKVSLCADTNRGTRAYVGYTRNVEAMSLIGIGNVGAAVTWGQVHTKINMIRAGIAGSSNLIHIGAVDYTSNEEVQVGSPATPPVYVGTGDSVTIFSDFTESVQDVVGALIIDSSTIDMTYNDAGNSLSLVVIANSLSNGFLATMADSTIKGRAVGGGTGNAQDLTAAQSLAIIATAITAKGNLIVGSGVGTVNQLAVGANDTVLVADSAATNGIKWANPSTASLAANSVTNAKLAQMVTTTVKGRALASGTGDPVDLTAAQLFALWGSVAVSAKGDLLVGTGAGVVNNMAVGANNTLLVADSAQSGGMRWATAAQLSAILAPLFADDIVITNASPQVVFIETGVTANNTVWDWLVDAEGFYGRVVNDAFSSATIWLSVQRTANTVDSVGLAATLIQLDGLTKVTQTLQVTGGGSPAAGAGVEIGYGSSIGAIASYDRGGAAYKELDYNALFHVWKVSGVEGMRLTTNNHLSLGGTNDVDLFNLVGAGAWLFNNTSDYIAIRLRGADGTHLSRIQAVGDSNGVHSAIVFGQDTPAGAGTPSGSSMYLQTMAGGSFQTSVKIEGLNKIGIGTSAVGSVQGNLHIHDGTAGHMFVDKTGVAGTAVVLIPNASGDVTGAIAVQWAMTSSGGHGTSGNTNLVPGQDTVIFTSTPVGNTFSLRCNADGSLDVRRTAGALTYSFACSMTWL